MEKEAKVFREDKVILFQLFNIKNSHNVDKAPKGYLFSFFYSL
jgi:hypothetical protein